MSACYELGFGTLPLFVEIVSEAPFLSSGLDPLARFVNCNPNAMPHRQIAEGDDKHPAVMNCEKYYILRLSIHIFALYHVIWVSELHSSSLDPKYRYQLRTIRGSAI